MEDLGHLNFISRLQQLAEQNPGKEALVESGKRINYGELYLQVNQLANGLLQLGLKEGDRVLIALNNCTEFIISYYATIRAKGVLVTVNPQYTLREISVIVNDCEPKTIITSSQFAEKFSELARSASIPLGIIVTGQKETLQTEAKKFEELLFNSPTTFSGNSYEDDDLIEFLYTSGTTGVPKGAMLSHKNLFNNAVRFAEHCDMTKDDRTLLVVPAFHSAGQTNCINNTLVCGGTVVIYERWTGVPEALKAIEEEKITFFFAPPTIFTFILNYPELDKYNLSSLRIAYTGGASLPEEVFRKFHQTFGFEILEGYGLSEASPVVCVNPHRGMKKIGSVGLPLSGVKVRIVDENDNILPPKEVGEIVVQGDNVMKGYYNKVKETAETLRNGWLHTGDMAYTDDDGYIYVVDRKKDMIIRGGLNIYPREVEEVLYSNPHILETAVVGIKDPVMGEEVKAFIVLKNPEEKMDLEELRQYCLNNLVKYKVPKFFEIVEQLPKTMTGKILKRELRK